MSITSKNYAKKFREEILSNQKEMTQRHTFLLPEQVDEFNLNLGGSSYYRIFFGLPLKNALLQGYKISVKGYFESTDSPIIEYTAVTVKNLLENELAYTGVLDVVDLFTGAGQAAYAFAKNGFVVTTIELDKQTFIYATKNIIKSGVKVNSICDDARVFLSIAEKQKKQFTVIFLDPPWNGKYKYNLAEKFYFSDTDPNAEELIKRSLSLALVVVFKAPINLDHEQVKNLASKLNCKAIIQYQYMKNYEPQHNNVMVYFIRNNKGFLIEHVSVLLG